MKHQAVSNPARARLGLSSRSGTTHVALRAPRPDGDDSGVTAQFYQNEELMIGRRFDRRMDPMRTPREMAIAWAEEERKRIEGEP